MRDAQSSRAPVQRLADRISAISVPSTIIALSIVDVHRLDAARRTMPR